MAKDSDTSVNNKSQTIDDSDTNKSFVKKVKSRVSGFLPSSLSRWFGSNESQIRYRDDTDDEDEESFQIQPPTKRIKPNETLTPIDYQNSISLSTPKQDSDVLPNKLNINSLHHVDNKITFPEPVAGPSGYRSRKNHTVGKSSLNKQLYTVQDEILNGDQYSDSGESVTSDYSSMRMCGKDIVNESKKESVNDNVTKSRFSFNTNSRINERSLFGDHCTSPQQLNPSLSSRQPSFNSSVFGSPNFLDRTLSSKRILNSPFYGGRTTYGGASAYGRQLVVNSSNPLSSTRNTVQIKPMNDSQKTTKDHTTLSKTARRILDTLEQYTTPISDAKKIPNPSIRKKYLVANPYSPRQAKVPSNKELQVPTVPDLLKMKLKERLQDSTVTVRQIAKSSKSVLNREEYKIRTLEEDEDGHTKHTNKMKNKISSVRQKNEPRRTVEEVKLPDIQLPISTLPKFDFNLPAVEPVKIPSSAPITKTIETVKTTTSTSKIVEKVSNTKKTTETNKTDLTILETCKKDTNTTESNKTETKKSEYTKVTEFKFSDPLVIAENLKSVRAINNFIFSEPIATSKTSGSPILNKDADKTDAKPITTKNNGECHVKNTLDMFKRNTDDVLTKTKPSNDTWECTVCFVRNLNTKSKCQECDSLRAQENKKISTQGFGDKFKMKENQWQCTVCMVVNSMDVVKCVACQCHKQPPVRTKAPENNTKFDGNRLGSSAPKTDKWECQGCWIKNNQSDLKCVACSHPKPVTNGPLKPELKIKNSFGDKFAPPPDTWSCDTCSIRNKNELSKCLACQSPRPAHVKVPTTGFGDSFKKKEDQWECDSCMVRNPQDIQKCQCCDASKPGAKNLDIPREKGSISMFNFGIDTNSKLTTQGFTFGIKPAENQLAETESKPAFSSVFGQNTAAVITSSATAPTFSFGIKSQPLPVQPAQEKSEEVQVPKTTPVAKVDSNKISNENVKPAVTLPNPVEIAKPALNSNERKVEESKSESHTLNGETKPINILFGVPPSTPSTTAVQQQQPTVSNSVFGKEEIVPTAPTFTFGASPVPTTSSSASIFGANPPQNTTAPPVFKFSTGEPAAEKPSLFGAMAKPIVFGNLPNQPLTAFGGTSTAPMAFNSSNNNNNNNSKNKQTLFEASPAAATSSPAPANPFGNRDTTDQPPAKMSLFSFGQPKKSETDQPKFGFGAVQSSTTSGGFNFGQAATVPQPNLNFNAGSGTAAAPSVNFESAAANQNGAPVFNFGAAAAATPSKGGFNFGANMASTAQKQGSATTAPPTANAGAFNFGFTGNTPAPSTGGFNFNSTTLGAANFNFSATAPSTFSAQPGENKSGRVIRKALRRAQR